MCSCGERSPCSPPIVEPSPERARYRESTDGQASAKATSPWWGLLAARSSIVRVRLDDVVEGELVLLAIVGRPHRPDALEFPPR
jgi:hypothetical protein